MFSQPVALTFIFQTIGVILAVTAVGVFLVKSNKRSKTSQKKINKIKGK